MKWVGPPQVAVFVPANSRAFFTANGGFLILFLFSLPSGRRDGVWRRISESSLSRYFPPRTGAKGEALKRNKTFCITFEPNNDSMETTMHHPPHPLDEGYIYNKV